METIGFRVEEILGPQEKAAAVQGTRNWPDPPWKPWVQLCAALLAASCVFVSMSNVESPGRSKPAGALYGSGLERA